MVKATYLVETTLGATLVAAKSTCFSQVEDGVFLAKPAYYLNVGELVLYEKQGIETTLEKVDHLLMESPRYKTAAETVLLKNTDNDTIPRFRYDLIHALVPHISCDVENLERKIAREGIDFAPYEYAAFHQQLKQRLDGVCDDLDLPSRATSTLDSWLRGRTLAPSDWRLFDALATALDAPVFSTTYAPSDLIESFLNVLLVIQVVFVGIAAISLLVGGIGIMNTMYTSVLERTREIGVMKAIGARNSDVLGLFLIESGLLGLAGGTIGVLIGIAISKSVEVLANTVVGPGTLYAYYPAYLIIGALAFSVIVGMISGVLPARRASKLKPVDALREE